MSSNRRTTLFTATASTAALLLINASGAGNAQQPDRPQPVRQDSWSRLRDYGFAQMISGNYLLAEGNYLKAIRLMEEKRAGKDFLAATYCELATAFYADGNLEKSTNCFKEALTLCQELSKTGGAAATHDMAEVESSALYGLARIAERSNSNATGVLYSKALQTAMDGSCSKIQCQKIINSYCEYLENNKQEEKAREIREKLLVHAAGTANSTAPAWYEGREEAKTAYSRHDFERSKELLKKAAGSLESKLALSAKDKNGRPRDGATVADLLECLSRLGKVDCDTRAFNEAVVAYERAYQLASINLWTGNPELADIMSMLGLAYRQTGRLSESADFLAKAIEIGEHEPAGQVDYWKLAQLQVQLVYDYHDMHDSRLEPTVWRVIENCARDVHRVHAIYGWFLTYLTMRNRTADEIKLRKFYLKVVTEMHRLNTKDTVTEMIKLACALKKNGQQEEADKYIGEALAISESCYSKDDRLVSSVLLPCIEYWAQRKVQAERMKLIQQALRIEEAAKPPNRDNLVKVIDQLGWCYFEKHKLAEARAAFERELAIKLTDPQPDRAFLHGMLIRVASLSGQLGDRAKFSKYVEMDKKYLPSESGIKAGGISK